jgi:hypothetical protein
VVFGHVEDEVDGDRGPQTVMWSKEFYETDPARDSSAATRCSSLAAPAR